MNDVFIDAAIRILQELHADITPINVWTILDLQGIADDVSRVDIETYMNRGARDKSE